jgi:predicted nucleic acid-binding protein
VAAYFFDSSALVKRYTREVGTTWVTSLFRPPNANRIYVSRITSVEVVSALTRRVRARKLDPKAASRMVARLRRAIAGRCRMVEITEALVERATSLAEKHALRGYDAVQLAATLTANDERVLRGASALILISADDALNSAAVAEGLTVDNPNHHP